VHSISGWFHELIGGGAYESKLEPLFYTDEAVVNVHHFAGKIVELLIETGEVHVHIRAQITDASILKVKAHQDHYQRQAQR